MCNCCAAADDAGPDFQEGVSLTYLDEVIKFKKVGFDDQQCIDRAPRNLTSLLTLQKDWDPSGRPKHMPAA